MYYLRSTDNGAKITLRAPSSFTNGGLSHVSGTTYPQIEVTLTLKGMDYSSWKATFDFTAEGSGSFSKYLTGNIGVTIYNTPLFSIGISEMDSSNGGLNNYFSLSYEVTLPYESDGTMDNINLVWEGLSIYGRTVKVESALSGYNQTEFIRPLQQEPFFVKAPFVYYPESKYSGSDTIRPEFWSLDEHSVYNYSLVVPHVPAGANKLKMMIPTTGGTNLETDALWEFSIDNPEIGLYEGRFALDNEGRFKLLQVMKETGSAVIHLTTFLIGFAANGVYQEPVSIADPLQISISLEQPVVMGTVEDTNPLTIALTGDSSVLILNASSALTKIQAEAVGTAVIREKSIQNGAESVVNVNEYTWQEVKSHIFYFGAIDNRSYGSTVKVEVPYIDYVKPTAVVKGSIVTGEGNLNLRVFGSYFDGYFGVKNNTISVNYRYKEQGAEDSTFSNWFPLPEVDVDTESKTYSVSATISGLEYTKTYVIQACINDELSIFYSADYVAASKPIFDWSATDFNFNVPVTIMGSTVMTGGSSEPKILWEGTNNMKEGQVIALSEAISAQASGILLVFDYAGTGTVWMTHYVPKAMVQIYNGGAHVFMMATSARLEYVGGKQLYISDTEIGGHEYNNDNAEVASEYTGSNVKFRKNMIMLRYVLGV